MQPAGGLKLAVKGAGRDDRRVRFAHLTVALREQGDESPLVTDARGRLRCHLDAGEYLLRLDEGGETAFSVREGRWTAVQVRLP